MTTATVNLSDSVELSDHRVAVFARMSDPHVLATLLCRVLQMRPLDAVIVARHVPGVLSAPMTCSQSQQLVSLLHELGVAAASVAVVDLPALGNAKTIHHARCLDEGLQILDLRGNPDELVPWSEIDVIAIGCIPGDPTPRFMERGRPSIVSAAPIPEVSRVDAAPHHVLELWLLRRGAAEAYRLRHNHFNYETLKESETESATLNFERLARDVIDRAATARRTPSTHAYLAHDRSKYEFQTPADLERHVLLHSALERVASRAPAP